MRGSHWKLYFSEKDGGKAWKNYVESIMYEEMIGVIMWKEMQ